jgi:NAD(P)-dependent dehydrogenase (short-subunit alcohol dehydrogenase family)
MREQGSGSIVNMSSVSALIGSVERGPYSASKAGLLGLTRVLATELGATGVRVNALLPGPVETKLSDDAYTPEIFQAFVGRTALGRRGRPSEIADAALFLASDESSYMTGQSLVVDGGYLTTGLR